MSAITLISDDLIETKSGATVERIVIRLGSVQSNQREIYLTPNGSGGYNIIVIPLPNLHVYA